MEGGGEFRWPRFRQGDELLWPRVTNYPGPDTA